MSIYTSALKPVFISIEEREQFINSLESKFSTISEWVDYITTHHATLMQKARWYIFQNWEKIKNWDDYTLTINDVQYTNHRMSSHSDDVKLDDTFNKLFEEIDSKRVNIDNITVSYDYHDADIYVFINSQENIKVLNEDEVLKLAIYIEENINEQQ